MIKRYGVPFEPEEASANQEALEAPWDYQQAVT